MLLGQTIARNLLGRGMVTCRTDELSRDVVHNQIIKTVAARLARTNEVEASLQDELGAIVRKLEDIGEIPLTEADFARVQLHGNNAFYGFLLRVCALAHEALVPEQDNGRFRFRDLLADERTMGLVFQDFVRNFYRLEQDAYRVSSDSLPWAIEPGMGHGHELLPVMNTDVSLRSKERTMVIECKWYREPLAMSYGRQELRADHLYQLFSYLKNLEARSGSDAEATGILLYPEAGGAISATWRIQAHTVRIRSLDLTQAWSAIHAQLLSVLSAD
jgi:5-methylcytosine-specific restriction enzyme subunit McrC